MQFWPVQIRSVIFDLDGTLIHSAVDFIKLKKRTIKLLSQSGLPAEMFSMEMKTYEIMQYASKLLKDQRVKEEEITLTNRKVSEAWNRIELESVDKTKPTAGAEKVIQTLRKRGLKIGVVTRGCREYAVEALKLTGLLESVDILIGRDDSSRPKPSPEPLMKAINKLNLRPDEAVMIGDNIDDAQCAFSAKVRFIGIIQRQQTIRTFEGTRFEAILTNLEDLLDILLK